MPTVPLQANNRIWLTYKHFPYKPWNAVAELVDNSVQSYLDNKRALNKQLKADKEHFSVRIDHAKEELFSIWDNAMGDGPRRPQSRRPARPSAAEHKGPLRVRHGDEDLMLLARRALDDRCQEARNPD